MGQIVAQLCSENPDVEIAAGINRTPIQKNDFPVYSDPMEFPGEADVLIDFSNPANLTALLLFWEKTTILKLSNVIIIEKSMLLAERH